MGWRNWEIPHTEREQLEEQLTAFRLLASDEVQAALTLAEIAHRDQKRDEGKPYLEYHIYPVTLEVVRSAWFFAPLLLAPTLPAAALLHDAVEDSGLTLADVQRYCGEQVRVNVEALTKPPRTSFPGSEEEQRNAVNEAYFKGLRAAPHEAHFIKLEDRLQNLRTVHLGRNVAKTLHYIRETRQWHLPFAQEVCSWYAQELESTLKVLEKRYGSR